MRIIDADKLMLSLADWELQESPISTYPKPKEFTADDMQRMIWRTIRDCESAVEEQPTVKSIPIEWILNKYREKWVKAEMERRDFQFIEVIDELLADWEKENEKDI